MWKAIVWGLAGLPLGIALGGALGVALGAIAATVAVSVAGALHFHRHKAGRAVCEPKAGAPVWVKAALALPVAAAVAVHVLAPALALVPVVTCAILGLCAVGCVALYRLVRYGRPMRPARVQSGRKVRPGLRVVTARTRATAGIAAPPRQLEAPGRVLEGVIISKKEAIR